MTSPTLTSALALWHSRDRSELAAALVPPVDALGDEVIDLSLARTFRRLAGMESTFEQVADLLGAIGFYQHIIVVFPKNDAPLIEAMIAVLEGWVEAVLDDGAIGRLSSGAELQSIMEMHNATIARAEAAESTVAALRASVKRLEEALLDLTDQVERSNAIDDHGHDLKNLRALSRAREALEGT